MCLSSKMMLRCSISHGRLRRMAQAESIGCREFLEGARMYPGLPSWARGIDEEIWIAKVQRSGQHLHDGAN